MKEFYEKVDFEIKTAGKKAGKTLFQEIPHNYIHVEGQTKSNKGGSDMAILYIVFYCRKKAILAGEATSG